MRFRPQSGFTLVELVVALAVAAVLLGVGVPSFVGAIKNSRTSSTYNEFVGALYLARSEAVKSARRVTVCARATDATCGTDWDQGTLVFVDESPFSTGTPAVISGTDRVIAVGFPIPDANDATLFSSASGSVSDAVTSSWLSYRGDGSTNANAASLLLCDDRGADFSRAMNIVLTGDLRRARPDAAEKTPRDVFNRKIDCPDPA